MGKSCLGLIEHFHAAIKKQILKFRGENSSDTTFPEKRTLRESREAWKGDQGLCLDKERESFRRRRRIRAGAGRMNICQRET